MRLNAADAAKAEAFNSALTNSYQRKLPPTATVSPTESSHSDSRHADVVLSAEWPSAEAFNTSQATDPLNRTGVALRVPVRGELAYGVDDQSEKGMGGGRVQLFLDVRDCESHVSVDTRCGHRDPLWHPRGRQKS
jgi:hypothetical protein